MAGLSLDQGWRDRSAVDHAVAALVGAWFGDPPESRAAMAAAVGDLPRAGAIAGGVWRCLAEGDLAGALRGSRGDARGGGRTLEMALAEAEALMAAGMVVSGLGRLRELHRAMYPAATVALTRHHHRLGDHAGAQDVAMMLPGHAQASLTGAKAALADRRSGSALRFLEPFLSGVAPIPDAMVAGAVAMVAASALARLGRREDLERLAAGLLDTRDLADEMIPAVARVAWTAGRATGAWERFGPDSGEWAVAGRLELALLAGDVALATRLMIQAGALGAPSRPVLALLNGGERRTARAQSLFAEGRRVHVWRTHPHRWAPWLAALDAVPADVEVFDLAAGRLPDERTVPDVVIDDGSLLDLVEPRAVPPRPGPGSAVWVEPLLCAGRGIGHDWPQAEDRALAERLGGGTAAPGDAAVWVAGAETALAAAAGGRPTVVIAPPGDPFWAGPFPGRAWPAMHVVRVAAREGWAGAGVRAAEAALALAAGRIGEEH